METIFTLAFGIFFGFLIHCAYVRILRNRQDVKKTVSDLTDNAPMWNEFSNSLPVHLYIKNADDDFKYLYSNRCRNECFGIFNNSLIGKNDYSLLSHEVAKKQLDADIEIMSKPKGIYEDYLEAKNAKGEIRNFRIAQTQFVDDTGRRLILGASLDITDLIQSRKKLEDTQASLKKRELWLQFTLKSIGDAVVVTDKSGNVVLLNPVAEQILGINGAEVVGKPHGEIFKIFGEQDGERKESPVDRVMQNSAIVELANHKIFNSKTEQWYHISDSAAPILDNENNIYGTVLVFRNVTEEYRRRTELNHSLKDWEMASIVGGIASFRINFKTRKVISCSKRFPEYWPIKDGMVVKPNEWILPEDIEKGKKVIKEIIEGKENHTFYKYRAMQNGKIHHYRIFGIVDSEQRDEITGIIQDLTDISESEMRLKSARNILNNLIDQLPVNFFSKNADDNFRYVHCNKNFTKLVKKTEAEIIGKTDDEIFPRESDFEQFIKVDRKIIKSGVASNFTETVYGANNTPLKLQTIKMPCIGPMGERLLLGISMDITKLVNLSKGQDVIKQCLEDLVSEKDLDSGINKALKSISEYINVSKTFILRFNTENRTVTCINEYCQFNEPHILDSLHDIPYSTGFDWEKHFNNECFLNFPDLQNKDVIEKFGFYYGKMIIQSDYRSLYCHRLFIDGKFFGYVGLAYEKKQRILTKEELDFVQSAARFIELMIRHKRTQVELRDALENSRIAEKAKSKFLATMSHEIRTPLNAVIGYSEILKDANISKAEQNDYLNDISVAGNALLVLINDILDLSKLEAGKMQFVNSPTDFPNLIRELMIIFRQKLVEKNLKYSADIQPMPLIKVDTLRFRQILFNLVGNAVKFTKTGGIAISVSFEKNVDGKSGTLKMSVRDTGCGISKDDAEKLFKPFEQARSTLGSLTAQKGTGLGLAIVKKMLECMNGEITLESELGKGSTFSIVIPEIEFEPDNVKLPQAENISPAIKNLRKHTILVVDDVPMNLKVMRALLSKLGMQSFTANSVNESLKILQEQSVDILFTDLWMPEISGAELAKRIRNSGKYPNLAIVATTADTESKGNFDMSSFDAEITKPVSIAKISDIIGKIETKYPPNSI